MYAVFDFNSTSSLKDSNGGGLACLVRKFLSATFLGSSSLSKFCWVGTLVGLWIAMVRNVRICMLDREPIA